MKFPALILLLSAHLATAGIVIVEETVQPGGPMGGKNDVTISMSGDQTRMDLGKMISTIVDSKSGEVTSLMHSQKMAMQLPKGAVDAMKNKLAQNKQKPDLKPTGKKETINGFACEEYAGTIQGLNVSFWVTQDVPHQKEILDQINKLGGTASPFQAALQSGKDFPGFPIRTTITLPNNSTATTTVVSVKEQDVPASTFVVPSDYKLMKMPVVPGAGQGHP